MDPEEIFDILGPEWGDLKIYIIGGMPLWIGCRVIKLLNLTNTTQAIRGRKDNPKMHFPQYRMHYLPMVNGKRSVYMLSIDGIVGVIKKNRTKTCKLLKMKLRIYASI